ncbi:MAG: bifunctional 4-hydroxy-3-methylbut-2-enyl diphosphate reductase/30S ribosomal protein S1 [Peptococcaceae bacterium]|nr:MAG: bifunctional 4-hydroxy-3-methylbut-2-enyl diphosphate reductase/30S ribosomal protein S1 [Peptococcaceae bacterium]
MEVRVAAKAGFCFGVKRAMEIAESEIKEQEGPVYSLGPIIHNPQVVSYLAGRGIKEARDLGEVDSGSIIIRSHGVGPDILALAKEKNLNVLDATCPFVGRAQEIARNLTAEGYQVVVVGDKDHPEVQGIVGWTDGRAVVVETPEQVKNLPEAHKFGVVAQTTQTPDNFEAVVHMIEKTGAEVKVCNTICHATMERQQAALNLARQADVMVVVGGAQSANTGKLTSLCAQTGTPTYQIEGVGELDPVWFREAGIIGLTAGASTPDWVIEEVKRRMKDYEEMSETGVAVTEEGATEEVAAEEVEEVNKEVEQGKLADVVSEEGVPEENMDDAVEVRALRYGEIVKGTVVHVGQDEVLVDVGAKSEGVVPLRELTANEITSPQDVVKMGDEIEVCVIKTEDNEGRLVLSKEKADAERAWVMLEDIFSAQEPVSGIVREVVKGGLVVDVGVRAFLPASLVERGYVEDLSKYVGQSIKAKVIEINRSRKKVILSRKVVLTEEYNRIKHEVLSTLQEGQVIKGIVRRLTQFGAFVDVGGVDGLLHISEMSWYRIGHPSEVVKAGDELEVMVLRIDRENEKISLGLKQVVPNPWDTVKEKYPVGNIVMARVVRLAPFGAFVQLEPGVEGLIHISHLANHHVVKPDEVISEGEGVNVKILSVNPEEKRIRLSIKEVDREMQEVRTDESYNRSQEENKEITIGEMVGEVFNNKEG